MRIIDFAGPERQKQLCKLRRDVLGGGGFQCETPSGAEVVKETIQDSGCLAGLQTGDQ